jgi:hypothetical protein
MILRNPDDDTETDIGEYHKDLLLANWKYFAAVFLGMEEDVIAYFSGRKPGTTISSHYRDFSNPFQLMQLRSYFTRMELLFSDYITTEHSSHVTLKDLNRTIRSSPQYDATELDIEFCLRDSGEQKFCINAPYGCHVEIEIIKEK